MDHPPVELTTDECLSLLRSRTIGRIALNTTGGLRVYPVNYGLRDAGIVFRTVPYGDIAANAHQAEVAFQVDRLDEETHRGWTVLAVGPCRRVEDPGEVRIIREEGDPAPWAAGQRTLYFRLDWVDLSGRQLGIEGRPSPINPGRAST